MLCFSMGGLLHDLCLEVLTVFPICCAYLRPRYSAYYTINVANLTQQQQIQLITSLAMTQFAPSIQPTTFPMQSGCVIFYATDLSMTNLKKLVMLSRASRNNRTFKYQILNVKIFNLRNSIFNFLKSIFLKTSQKIFFYRINLDIKYS